MAGAGLVGQLIWVEKRKWDGTVAAREEALLLDCDVAMAWRVRAGSRRERPRRGDSVLVAQDELWLSLPDAPVLLCSYLTTDNAVERSELHAALAPVGRDPGLLTWIDLDLDVALDHDTVEVLDEQKFMDHAATMHYPQHVVSAAWAGIASVTPRYVNHGWPFDGFVERLARAETP